MEPRIAVSVRLEESMIFKPAEQLVAPPALGALGGVAGVASIFLFLAALLGVAAMVVVASPLMGTGLQWHEDRKPLVPPAGPDGAPGEPDG